MKNTENFVIIICNTPNIDKAKEISHNLVKQKLAACVNIIDKVTSIYEWEGKIVEDTETTLVIKTLRENSESVESEILSLHPYDVPEIIRIDVTSSNENYYNWLKSVVSN